MPFFIADAARADFRVCNGTQNLVGVAIGYRAKDGWVTEGWWQVPATTCATLIEGELQSRYYYLYAEDAARGGDGRVTCRCAWRKTNSKSRVCRIVMPAVTRKWDSRNMIRAARVAGWFSSPTPQGRKKARIDEA